MKTSKRVTHWYFEEYRDRMDLLKVVHPIKRGLWVARGERDKWTRAQAIEEMEFVKKWFRPKARLRLVKSTKVIRSFRFRNSR